MLKTGQTLCRSRMGWRSERNQSSGLTFDAQEEHTLLKPRAWRYHSFTEFKVDLRVKSNMNKMATASLQTKGDMFTASLCPPTSQIENVIVVLRLVMVCSVKLTPRNLLLNEAKAVFCLVLRCNRRERKRRRRTTRPCPQMTNRRLS